MAAKAIDAVEARRPERSLSRPWGRSHKGGGCTTRRPGTPYFFTVSSSVNRPRGFWWKPLMFFRVTLR